MSDVSSTLELALAAGTIAFVATLVISAFARAPVTRALLLAGTVAAAAATAIGVLRPRRAHGPIDTLETLLQPPSSIADILVNVVLFMPLTAVATAGWPNRATRFVLIAAALLGELMQILIPSLNRRASVWDPILNVIGIAAMHYIVRARGARPPATRASGARPS